MPYYPEGKELEDACKKLRLYSVCAECGGKLVVRYDLAKQREYIICGDNEAHEGIRKTWAENLKQIRGEVSMDSVALMKLGEGGMLARIEQAKFPQALRPEEKRLIAEIALSYGLDPIMNELSIYQGRPYPTVNAWYRKSQETGQFDGMNSRPATKQERQERNAKEGDLLYCAEVWRKGSSHPFVGWGRVHAEETKGDKHLPIVKDPDRMAEKRAEMQGMKKAFSIPMPPSFEEVTEAYIAGIGRVIITEEETVETAAGTVVKGTGEIVDAKAEKVSETEQLLETVKTEAGAEPPAPPPDNDVLKPNVETPDKPITGEQLHALSQLCTDKSMSMKQLANWCNDEKGRNWGIKTFSDLKQWQLKEIADAFAKGQ